MTYWCIKSQDQAKVWKLEQRTKSLIWLMLCFQDDKEFHGDGEYWGQQSLVACCNQIRCCFGHIIMTSSSSKPCRTQSSFLSPLNDYFPKLSDKITNVTVSGLTCYTSVHFVSHGVRTTLILILNTLFRLEKPEWWEETLHQHSKHLWMQFLNFMPPSSLQLL